MKLSFSTVGCPNWTWTEILACAADLGFSGIELRGLGDDLSLRSIPVFQPSHIAETAKTLARKGLAISCVASDILLCGEEWDEEIVEHTIGLARGLDCKYIRVLGDKWGHPNRDTDEDLVKRRLMELAPRAEGAGVVFLVESNGVWADSAKLRKLIEDVHGGIERRGAAPPAVQVLWDMHHPYRWFGETPEETVANLGPYIRHVHIKDSVMEDKKLQYKMLTYGDMPLAGMLTQLKRVGYGGYLSMEWVKRWNAELEEPGVAFAHFTYSLEKLLGQIG